MNKSLSNDEQQAETSLLRVPMEGRILLVQVIRISRSELKLIMRDNVEILTMRFRTWLYNEDLIKFQQEKRWVVACFKYMWCPCEVETLAYILHAKSNGTD